MHTLIRERSAPILSLSDIFFSLPPPPSYPLGVVMKTQDLKRRLTAILSADVRGYSRLMREDEIWTVRTLAAYREVMAELIQEYRGRVVDTAGDNLLAEFASVLDAVQCAVEIQKVLKAKNLGPPKERKMEFRIGINLGDVIDEGDRIYGDGVNIAARLENLAQAGGICISRTVYENVKNKLSLRYEYLGAQGVKNVPEAVPVYRVLIEAEPAGNLVGEKKLGTQLWWRVALVAALIMGTAAVAIWNSYLRPAPPPPELASEEKTALPHPEKPSIAVLPFVNISDDPQQEYFSDGITTGIITALSKVPEMFVIARNSSFTYKGKSVKVQRVGKELGVRYVLGGDVQKAAGRVRITVQLVDAATGNHLWAERYDKGLKDLFALQDEITMDVLTALQVKLTEGEQALVRKKETNNLEALEKHNQGLMYFRQFNRESNLKARQVFEEAVALDPGYAGGYRMLAWTHVMDVWLGWTDSSDRSMEQSVKLAEKAFAQDESNAETLALYGTIDLLKGRYAKAIAKCKRALALNPNMADNTAILGIALNNVGRYEEATAMFEKAIRLNPFPPVWYIHNLGVCYRLMGRYEEAVSQYEKVLQLYPGFFMSWVDLTATRSLLGRDEEARAAAAEVLKIDPNFSVERYVKDWPDKDQEPVKRFIEALHIAGLR